MNGQIQELFFNFLIESLAFIGGTCMCSLRTFLVCVCCAYTYFMDDLSPSICTSRAEC